MGEYSVYCHIFPNGKRYIGITKTSVERRWNNGHGYDTQPKIKNAISKYGWENVKHEILANGLTKKRANELEEHYISEYDTLRNGYNSTIGGDNILTCYLSTYILEMLRYTKTNCPELYKNIEFVYDGRNDKEASEFWNEAAKAVTAKHGKFSTTAERNVEKFWFHIAKYCELYCKVKDGEDVSGWREGTLEEYIVEDLFRASGIS